MVSAWLGAHFTEAPSAKWCWSPRPLALPHFTWYFISPFWAALPHHHGSGSHTVPNWIKDEVHISVSYSPCYLRLNIEKEGGTCHLYSVIWKLGTSIPLTLNVSIHSLSCKKLRIRFSHCITKYQVIDWVFIHEYIVCYFFTFLLSITSLDHPWIWKVLDQNRSSWSLTHIFQIFFPFSFASPQKSPLL